MFSIKKFTTHDYIITIILFLLSIISLIVLYSTTYTATTLEGGAGTFERQILFFIIGYFLYFALSSFDTTWLRNQKILGFLYFSTILLLIYVLIFAPEIAGTKRWITFFGFNFQPSEYAKVVLIIVTAGVFSLKEEGFMKMVHWNQKKSSKKTKGAKKQKFFEALERVEQYLPGIVDYLYSIVLLAPFFVLVFLEPAFGNSMIILTIWSIVVFAASRHQLAIFNFLIPVILIPLNEWGIINFDNFLNVKVASLNLAFLILVIAFSVVMLFKSNLKPYLLLLAIVIGVLIQPIVLQLWNSPVLTDYQKQRIETYLAGPEDDPQDAGYQVNQSKVAIGSGRLWGRGFLQGTQSSLKVLPFAHTDFIFASLAEQFGLFGSSLVLFLYIILIARILVAAVNANNEFSFLLAVGVAAMMLINIFINVGMNMGKLPVTGVPLPFLSYGGSAVLINMIGLGLVQAVNSDKKPADIAESLTPNANPWV